MAFGDGPNGERSITYSLALALVPTSSSYWLVAPSTTPTMLYLLLKKVTQSSSVDFSFSSRSCQSELTSSALVELLPSAREASFPAKTVADQRAFQPLGAAFVIIAYRDRNLPAGRLCYLLHHTPCPVDGQIRYPLR